MQRERMRRRNDPSERGDRETAERRSRHASRGAKDVKAESSAKTPKRAAQGKGRPSRPPTNASNTSPDGDATESNGLGASSSVTAPSARPSRRDEARALFRNAILDAAEETFAEHGYHGARIQDIAERARMAVGTIYNHFGQKEDVLRELVDERFGSIAQALDPAEHEPRNFEARLTERITRLFVLTFRHRAFFAMTNELGLTGGQTTAAAATLLGEKGLLRVERFRMRIRAQIEDGIGSGAIPEMDVELLTLFLGGAIRAVGHCAKERRTELTPEDAASDAKMVVDLFMHGARKKRNHP
jgi:AcrR family transcriptional regulator